MQFLSIGCNTYIKYPMRALCRLLSIHCASSSNSNIQFLFNEEALDMGHLLSCEPLLRLPSDSTPKIIFKDKYLVNLELNFLIFFKQKSWATHTLTSTSCFPSLLILIGSIVTLCGCCSVCIMQ